MTGTLAGQGFIHFENRTPNRPAAAMIPCRSAGVAHNLGKYYYIDGRNTQLISLEKNVHWGREKGPPKLHPRGGFFGP